MPQRSSFVSSQRSMHQPYASALDGVVVFPDGSVTWIPETTSHKAGSATVRLFCLKAFLAGRQGSQKRGDRPSVIAKQAKQTSSHAKRIELPIALVSCF